MPRKGKGQKVQTATGQGYGEAKMQEESQGVVALPDMADSAVPLMRPGEVAFNRPSERPMESVMTPSNMDMAVATPEVSRERRMKVMAALPILEEAASRPYANPNLRNAVRQMKAFVGNVEDLFQDRGE
tara:strand:- start:3860 stop:4246 length:387 start_codon:yes stop_codon:yes gene_type:complete